MKISEHFKEKKQNRKKILENLKNEIRKMNTFKEKNKDGKNEHFKRKKVNMFR